MTDGTEIHPDYADEPPEIGRATSPWPPGSVRPRRRSSSSRSSSPSSTCGPSTPTDSGACHHLHPSRAFGIGVLVCVLVSVAATLFAARSTRSGNAAAGEWGRSWRCSRASRRSWCSASSTRTSASARRRELCERLHRLDGLSHGQRARSRLLALDLLAESLGRVGRTPELIRPSARGACALLERAGRHRDRRFRPAVRRGLMVTTVAPAPRCD